MCGKQAGPHCNEPNQTKPQAPEVLVIKIIFLDFIGNSYFIYWLFLKF